MEPGDCRLLVVSHAGIKQINRAVYRELKRDFKELMLVVPEALQLGSGQHVTVQPAAEGDPTIVPMKLQGRNPRTYSYPGLISLLDQFKPDVVLLENDPVSRLGIQLARWCRRNGVRIICQTYENLRRDLRSTFARLGSRAVPKNLAIHVLNFWMASRVDALLVVNEDSESIFKSYGYNRVFRIPLGYDRNVFFQDDGSGQQYRDKLTGGSAKVVVAYFGRLVRQKGVHLLIDALSQLKALDWVLLLDHIHDSEDQYAQEIRNQISRNQMESRVVYFEADHFEIANYMRAADISVAPSVTTDTFKEQYGRAVQEAMACGCVTVVSDSGHLKDLVGDTSLVFTENDVSMLRDRLADLIRDLAKRQHYRSFLSERAATYLSTEAQSLKLRSLLLEL